MQVEGGRHLAAGGERPWPDYAHGPLSATLAAPMSETVHAPRPAMATDMAAASDGPALLSVSAAAKLVGCSRSTIARRVADGLMTRTPSGELHRGDVLRVCSDLRVREDDEADDDQEAAATAGQGRADGHGASTGTDALALAAHVEWMRELIDEQRATIARKDAALAEATERAERREATWLKQLDAMTTKLLPAPKPKPSRGLFRQLFG